MDVKKNVYSKCCVNCISPKKIKDMNSNINIAYAPNDCTLIATDDDELRLRIWSFMRPPKISTPTPIISPSRLEKVRNLLVGTEIRKFTKLDCLGMPESCEQCIEQNELEQKQSPCRKIQQQRRSQ